MNITINSEKEFQGYLKKYYKAVSVDNEIYCMFFYLEYLLVKHRQFPINIEIERESPDFVLQMSNTKIGLEHTRASCQVLTYGLKKLDDYPEGSMLEITDCGKIKPSKKSINNIIKKPGEKLTSDGWGNWGKEKFLIEAVINSIKEKTKKLNHHYEICPSNELIIYDDMYVPVRWDYVMAELNKQCIKTNQINFDKIHLVADETLYYNIVSGKH